MEKRVPIVLPRYRTLRRIPPSCRSILPLRVMKRYQCLVVGAAHKTLTVAITDQHHRAILPLLRMLTGRTIFTVFVDPARMQLLLRRLERSTASGATRGASRMLVHHLCSCILVLVDKNRGRRR